jgi:alpha-amylase/alpha-mannosidase (GH57 family)
MGFSMELIPLLAELGYRYVLVDSDHVEGVSAMSWHELRYRPHVARFGGAEIIVVVRDRELSDAQESGMDLAWFTAEVSARTRWCDFPPLVTTATDGDNGGWFRNPHPGANFWGLYQGLLDRARESQGGVRPTFIEDYLQRYGAQGEVRVTTGAWNTGWHHGRDFLQWTGSQAQRDALVRTAETSRAVHQTRERALATRAGDAELGAHLESALWQLLRAETSCNFFWGEAWVPRAHRDLDGAWASLAAARQRLG